MSVKGNRQQVLSRIAIETKKTTEKINKRMNWYSEKIKKIDQTLARQRKKERRFK